MITSTLLLFLTNILLPAVLFPIYFQFARKWNVSDAPGGRSSHTVGTLTGAGIVFLLSIVLHLFFTEMDFSPFFIIGLLLVGLISFWDDISPLKHSVRFLVQLIAVAMLVYAIPMSEFNGFYQKAPIWIAAIVFGVFVLNGFNFMDGINGLLGLNAFVILCSLAYLNNTLKTDNGQVLVFADPLLIHATIGALLVFLFFNLRSRAVTFMGDVGSISLAFIILYLMYSLISKTGNISYLLLFSVIGVDSGLTVVYKLILKENIFVPHRDFLFKKLVHIGRFGHLRISVVYALIQLLVNLAIIVIPFGKSVYTQISILFIVLSVEVIAFIAVRNKFTKRRIIKIVPFAKQQS
jgi:UDP-GlcNAc:undecaprenyl-phosphate GlcNAc-1-phosphate transferase